MTLHAQRYWGMAASAALMSLALVFAAQPAATAQGEAQQASRPTPAPVAFIVRFRGEGPIARAQAAAMRGRETVAQREIEAQLVRQTAFNGLCFDRFTVGAAEVVLRVCEPVAAERRAAVEAAWLARLRAMRAVEYVDANASAAADRR